MATKIERRGGSILRSIPDGWYTRSQAAEKIGVSYVTLKRWEDSGKIAPPAEAHFGKTRVPIFNTDSIEKIRRTNQTMNGSPQ